MHSLSLSLIYFDGELPPLSLRPAFAQEDSVSFDLC